jgi:hypothetical protein
MALGAALADLLQAARHLLGPDAAGNAVAGPARMAGVDQDHHFRRHRSNHLAQVEQRKAGLLGVVDDHAVVHEVQVRVADEPQAVAGQEDEEQSRSAPGAWPRAVMRWQRSRSASRTAACAACAFTSSLASTVSKARFRFVRRGSTVAESAEQASALKTAMASQYAQLARPGGCGASGLEVRDTHVQQVQVARCAKGEWALRRRFRPRDVEVYRLGAPGLVPGADAQHIAARPERQRHLVARAAPRARAPSPEPNSMTARTASGRYKPLMRSPATNSASWSTPRFTWWPMRRVPSALASQ